MIRTKQVLDYETATQTTFTLTVTVRDVADHSATQQITISLQNINDNTPEFSPNIYYVDVQENTTMGRFNRPFRVVLGWAYRGLTGGFLLLQNFCVAISVSPHVCFILVLILISMFLR